MPIPAANEVLMLVEEVSEIRCMSWRECAERSRRLVHQLEAVQALDVAGFDPDAEPDPASFPPQG